MPTVSGAQLRGESSNPRIDVRVAGAGADLARSEQSWRELLAESGNRSAMQHPDWMLTWWKFYSANREPAIVEFYDNGKLVGLAPLCRRLNRYGLGLSFRRLELMSAGVPDEDSVCGEYVGLLARPGAENLIASRFVSGLYDDEFGPWHECVLSMMDGTSAMTAALQEAFRRGGLDSRGISSSDALYVPLPSTWDAYLASMSKKRRGWIRSTMKDFTAWCGETGFRLEQATDLPSLHKGLTILTDLHSRRWGSIGMPGAFDRPRFRKFHEAFAERLLAAGNLDLTWLTIDGTPWAAQYNFVTGGRVHFYQGGRRMEAPSRIGLGNVMIILAMQRAIARGDSEFDFLGGESPYKTRFASHRRPLTELRVARPGLREGALQTARMAVRSLRMLGDVVRPSRGVRGQKIQEASPTPAMRSDLRQARNASDLS